MRDVSNCSKNTKFAKLCVEIALRTLRFYKILKIKIFACFAVKSNHKAKFLYSILFTLSSLFYSLYSILFILFSLFYSLFSEYFLSVKVFIKAISCFFSRSDKFNLSSGKVWFGTSNPLPKPPPSL